jgi:hypothetical protein
MFLSLLGVAPLAVAGFWEKKKFPEWTNEEIDTILTDSPWAKPVTLAFNLKDLPGHQVFSWSDIGLPSGVGFPRGGIGLPGGPIGWPGGGPRTSPGPRGGPGSGGSGGGGRGSGVRTEVYLTMRWSSALPIKQALVLDKFGSDAKTSPEAREILEREETHYVIEVFGLPAQMATMGPERLAEELQLTASLNRNGKRPISPVEIEVPPHGEHLALTFRFPRTDPITLADKQVEFFSTAAPFEFKQKFKLKSMLYDGSLAL